MKNLTQVHLIQQAKEIIDEISTNESLIEAKKSKSTSHQNDCDIVAENVSITISEDFIYLTEKRRENSIHKKNRSQTTRQI